MPITKLAVLLPRKVAIWWFSKKNIFFKEMYEFLYFTMLGMEVTYNAWITREMDMIL